MCRSSDAGWHRHRCQAWWLRGDRRQRLLAPVSPTPGKRVYRIHQESAGQGLLLPGF